MNVAVICARRCKDDNNAQLRQTAKKKKYIEGEDHPETPP